VCEQSTRKSAKALQQNDSRTNATFPPTRLPLHLLTRACSKPNLIHNLHDGGFAQSLSLLDAGSTVSKEDEDSDVEDYDEDLRAATTSKRSVDHVSQPAKVKVPSRRSITKWTNVLFKSKDEKSEVEKRHNLELHGTGRGLLGFGKFGSPKQEVQISMREATDALTGAMSTPSPSFAVTRASFCYALNNQRSVNTELSTQSFDALAEVMEAFLAGCCWQSSSEDVANAKMLMMLGQTFYCVGKGSEKVEDDAEGKGNNVGRKAKIYSSERDEWGEAVCVAFDKSTQMHTFESEGGGGACTMYVRERSEHIRMVSH